MLANRRTMIVKQGRVEELVPLIKMAIEAYSDYKGPYRIYIPGLTIFAPFDVLVMEFEYENIEEYHQLWAKWEEMMNTPEFQGKLNELAERGGTNELWQIAASR